MGKPRIYLFLAAAGTLFLFIMALLTLTVDTPERDGGGGGINIGWIMLAGVFAWSLKNAFQEYNQRRSSRTLGWVLLLSGLCLNSLIGVIMPLGILYSLGFVVAGAGSALLAMTYWTTLKETADQTTE
jgi:hypothetical protein